LLVRRSGLGLGVELAVRGLGHVPQRRAARRDDGRWLDRLA